jgi:hypothetical protein
MITKAIISAPTEIDGEPLIIPIALPDMDEVKDFALRLHKQGVEYKGEFAGWPVHYYPMRPKPLYGSSLSFTPAAFTIGRLVVWAMSLDWENGENADPLISVWDDKIISQ